MTSLINTVALGLTPAHRIHWSLTKLPQVPAARPRLPPGARLSPEALPTTSLCSLLKQAGGLAHCWLQVNRGQFLLLGRERGGQAALVRLPKYLGHLAGGLLYCRLELAFGTLTNTISRRTGLGIFQDHQNSLEAWNDVLGALLGTEQTFSGIQGCLPPKTLLS